MRFNNIQVLRLVAAVGVLLYHLGVHSAHMLGVDLAALRSSWLSAVPVPLFFAVSGFVLAHSVRSASPGRFLLARFLRLYPGYWLALLGVVALMRARLFTEYHRWLIYFVNATELTLLPAGPGRCQYLLGVEWSLVYEVFLSAALACLALVGGGRGVTALTLAWLAVIGVKLAAYPGFAFDTYPNGLLIALSAYNVPFLLGVLVYPLRGRGFRWRWAVLAAVAGLWAVSPTLPLAAELQWCNFGLVAAGVVWLAVQFRQVSDRNLLARLGDCTYGLFLVHVPLMMVVLYAAAGRGWGGRAEVACAAGVVALAGGLLFGRLESRVHATLRPLTKVTLPDVLVRVRRIKAGIARPVVGTGLRRVLRRP